MEAEMRRESWLLGSWWRVLRKSPVMEVVKSTEVVGALTHDIMSLMSKLIMLWNSLSDEEIMRLRGVVLKSAGICKLVSDEDDVLVELVLNEMIENWVYVAKYVSRVGKKCSDPVVSRLEEFLNDPDEYDLVCYEWEYNSKKMERKVRKMERLVGASMQLNQELEVLTEMEQTFRRMHLNNTTKKVRLLEFQQKIIWQSQMVKDIREKSLWNRTYDYTVRLMARSLFTILNRLKDTFDTFDGESLDRNCAGRLNSGLSLLRSQSFSAVVHSTGYPNEDNIYLQVQEPIEGSILISVTECNETKKKMGKTHHRSSHSFSGKNVASRSKNQVHARSFRGCMLSDYVSPSPLTCKPTLGGSMRLNSFRSKRFDISTVGSKHSQTCKLRIHSKIRLHCSKQKLSLDHQNTLGYSGLALYYANAIILIEKLAMAPHLIGKDARDDLYKRLPATVKSTLRLKLKQCAGASTSQIHDAQLATKWKSAVTQILEWLAPLAHDTIRWQAERNFEKQQSSTMTNALLVQTLYYADQKKTEAAVTELLIGLNYLCRVGTQVKTGKRLIPNEYMLQAEIVVL